ncbi:unnamed protein product [Pleuronectes platessa]|uniref:Uncharacterized protein n=1 Tax=Pleuronectes platessa TaxID=8262 RepID=A0A9N7VNP6_PLEPL|nr:unnamed protein product [Pleuronectes platessa]
MSVLRGRSKPASSSLTTEDTASSSLPKMRAHRSVLSVPKLFIQHTGNLLCDGGEHVAEVGPDTFLAEQQSLAPNPIVKSQDAQKPLDTVFCFAAPAECLGSLPGFCKGTGKFEPCTQACLCSVTKADWLTSDCVGPLAEDEGAFSVRQEQEVLQDLGYRGPGACGFRACT